MKKIGILILFLYYGCSPGTNSTKAELESEIEVNEDSVLLKFGQTISTFEDKRNPDGSIAHFRQLYITNLSNNPLYLNETNKFIRSYSYEFYSLKNNSWSNNFPQKIRDTTYYEILPGVIDTFLVSDHFEDSDSVYFHIDFYNPLTKSYTEFERFFTRDGKRLIRNRKE